MEENEILKGNDLISQFMGLKEKDKGRDWHRFPIERGGCITQRLKYHSSWDLVILVVDKIEKLGYDSRILGNDSDGGYLCDFVDICNNEVAWQVSYESKIKAVYAAVIDFIKWHNSKQVKNI